MPACGPVIAPVTPTTYASCATAAAAHSARAATLTIRMLLLISLLLSVLQHAACFFREQLFLAAIVHGLDQLAESLVHLPALHLARRRDRLALRFRIERLRQDAERLDLLDAGELGIGALELAPEQGLDLRMARQAGEAAVGNVPAARPVGNRVEVDLDQRAEILPRLAEHRDLRDKWARAHDVLDVGGRQCLAARGDDEIARPVEQPQAAVLPFADIAGAQPAIRAEHLARRFRLADVLLEHVVAADLDLAGVGDAQLPAWRERADVAGPWKRPTLAADQCADLFCLAVRLPQVHAPDLPEGGGFRRQRRSGAYDKAQLLEAQLV